MLPSSCEDVCFYSNSEDYIIKRKYLPPLIDRPFTPAVAYVDIFFPF